MIDITKSTEKCFADSLGECRVLSETISLECNASCPFYKPIGCREWVRINTKAKAWLLTPEEYEERFKDTEEKPPSWKISTKGVSQ